MRATADTVVIGGGVMGCSTLFNLARLGITNTVLLEKDILKGRSQSHLPDALLQPGDGYDGLGKSGRVYPLRGNRGRAVGVHGNRLPGGQGRRQARLGAYVARQHRLGIDTMTVTAADLRDIAPMVSVTEDEAMGWEQEKRPGRRGRRATERGGGRS